MLYYNRIDMRKGGDVAKSNNSKECIICHYLFFNHGFEFQDYVYSYITIITVKNIYYCHIFH